MIDIRIHPNTATDVGGYVNAVEISDIPWLQHCLIDHTAVGILSDDLERPIAA